MPQYQPPFQLSITIMHLLVEVGELMGRWAAQAEQTSPTLRKENRIRTIQASLAIEHNSLTLGQVSALMEGKRVLGPAKDIQEVRNAILAYEELAEWRSSSLDDLLAAHRLLMAGLVDFPGQLRQSNAGIYREDKLIHMAPPARSPDGCRIFCIGWKPRRFILWLPAAFSITNLNSFILSPMAMVVWEGYGKP